MLASTRLSRGTVSRGTAPRVAVVKVGGDVVLDSQQRQGLATNLGDLLSDGWQVVVLHGGGPQTTALQSALGRKANKVAGRRITSPEDLVIVTQAIAGEANVALTASLQGAGIPAFGCHGVSGGLIRATRRPPTVVEGGGPEAIDFGEVGDVSSVNDPLLRGLLDLGQVPVIATLGLGAGGEVFNINADTTVIQIAQALQAQLLVLATAVGAVFRDIAEPGSRLEQIKSSEAQALIKSGVIQGGMVPKVTEAFRALEAGVGEVAIVDAGTAGSFRSIANGERLSGTVLVR